MRIAAVISALILLLVPTVRALDEPKKPAEEIKKILDEYNKAYNEYVAAIRQAKTPEERSVAAKLFPNPGGYATRFLEQAQKDPKDDAALTACNWILSYDGQSDNGKKAAVLLIENHAANPKIGTYLLRLARVTTDEVAKLFKEVATKNTSDDVKGLAKYALAQQGFHSIERNRNLKPDEIDARNEKIETLLEEVAAKHGEVMNGATKLADLVKVDLFYLKNLTVGKKLPKVEGEDTDGKKFELADYKGKVIFLDFWAHW